MGRRKRIAKGVIFNWIAFAVTTLIGFFLAPFVVRHLGNLAYGVWVLVVSLNSYMNLLDLGMRGAVTRYVSRGVAQTDHDESSDAVSTALWIRLWISVAIILIGIGFSFAFPKLFTIPHELQWAARTAVLVTSLTVAVNLYCGVFGGVLAALHRFDLLSSVNMVQAVLRAGGFVYLLLAGHGILALAVFELCVALVGNSLLTLTALRVYPQLRVIFSYPKRETMRKLWSYSFYAFLINVAIQVVYYTDNIVVGSFVSATAVTFYAIGGSLIQYARQIVSSMTTTFTPLASTLEAEGREGTLRQLLIQGTRAALMVSLPIEAALFFRGHTFIGLWMGKQYAGPSGLVLQILLVSLVVCSANTTSGGIVYGMEQHKRIALWAILEAAANLTLSILLVRHIGIYGVAIGTTVPSLVIEFVLWPPYICKLVRMEVSEYLWQTWIKTFVAVIPFALACHIADVYWPARSLFTFFLQIAALLPLFPLTLAIIYWKELGPQVRTRWRQRFASAGKLSDECETSTTAAS